MPKFCSLRPCYSLRKTIGVFVKGKWRGIPPKFCTEDTYLVIFHRTFDTTNLLLVYFNKNFYFSSKTYKIGIKIMINSFFKLIHNMSQRHNGILSIICSDNCLASCYFVGTLTSKYYLSIYLFQK